MIDKRVLEMKSLFNYRLFGNRIARDECRQIALFLIGYDIVFMRASIRLRHELKPI